MTEEIKNCPDCNHELYRIYGCDWDYDVLMCPTRGCDFEIRLNYSSYPPPEPKGEIEVDLPDDLVKEAKGIADQLGITFDELVEKALLDMFNGETQKI